MSIPAGHSPTPAPVRSNWQTPLSPAARGEDMGIAKAWAVQEAVGEAGVVERVIQDHTPLYPGQQYLNLLCILCLGKGSLTLNILLDF